MEVILVIPINLVLLILLQTHKKGLTLGQVMHLLHLSINSLSRPRGSFLSQRGETQQSTTTSWIIRSVASWVQRHPGNFDLFLNKTSVSADIVCSFLSVPYVLLTARCVSADRAQLDSLCNELIALGSLVVQFCIRNDLYLHSQVRPFSYLNRYRQKNPPH